MVDYPESPRADVVDVYHGVPVPDPYRWLEEMDSPRTLAWVDAQNEMTFAHLATIEQRDSLRYRIEELWDFPRESAPVRRGDWYFFSRNDGLQPQPVLYKRPVEGGGESVVLDPNTLSEDGTLAIMSQSFTADGSLLAYSLAEAGSDWQTGRVLDTASGEVRTDELQWIKFTPFAWTPQQDAFFYSRYPAPGEIPDAPPSTHHRVFLHRLGTDQSQDELVYERPDAPDLGFIPIVTEDDELLVLHVWEGTDTRNRLYYRPVNSTEPFVKLLDDFDAKYELIGHVSGSLYILTDCDAPRGRIIRIDLDWPERTDWETVVPESAGTLQFASIVAGRLVVGRLVDAHHVVSVHELDGTYVRELELPDLGTVTEFAGKAQHRELFIGFQSFVHPPAVLRYDFDSDVIDLLAQERTTDHADAILTRQIRAVSKDGTEIPVFLIHRRDLASDSNPPTVLYGYGGFDISMTPLYSPDRLAFVEAGGVFAVANLRGGGEYGQDWHRAGMLENKQNVFDDFICVAEHLVDKGFTAPANLGIHGRSNGGLLVTACVLQRPDLFGAVVGMVPVTDMLRYHHFTAGRYWTPEYGNAEEEADDFRFLIEYSPLHNVQAAAYPPTLITTGDTDDRVVPLHSYKFVAALQNAAVQQRSATLPLAAGLHHVADNSGPVLLRVDKRAGHGLGKPTAMVIDEAADIYAFFLHHLAP
jgi:prolyl oligopeptidase